MLGSLNNSQIENLVRSQVVARLGCTAAGEMYVVPITYAYEGNYLYGHTIEGKKIKMMRENPQVCFEVDVIENMAHWQSVIGWGVYEELEGKQAEEGLQILVNRMHPLMSSETSRPKHGLDRTQLMKPNTRMVVFRIKIDLMTGRFEKQ